MAAESAANLFARLGHKKSLDGLDKQLFRSLSREIQAKDVIELYGEEGSGKTHILLHLTANCILPQQWEGVFLGGHGVGVFFVDTEYHLSLFRLIELLEVRVRASLADQGKGMVLENFETFIKSCLSRLIVAKCKSTEKLVSTIQNFSEILQHNADICVLMIDSISAFYLLDKNIFDDGYKLYERRQRKLVELLQRYAGEHQLVVLATLPALTSKDSRCIEKVQDYSYMSKSWRDLVTCAYVVSRQSSTFYMKQVKPACTATDPVVTFFIDKSGLKF